MICRNGLRGFNSRRLRHFSTRTPRSGSCNTGGLPDLGLFLLRAPLWDRREEQRSRRLHTERAMHQSLDKPETRRRSHFRSAESHHRRPLSRAGAARVLTGPLTQRAVASASRRSRGEHHQRRHPTSWKQAPRLEPATSPRSSLIAQAQRPSAVGRGDSAAPAPSTARSNATRSNHLRTLDVWTTPGESG